MKAEGWYQDPYRTHQDRWYSDGTPTPLVRDGEVESHDPPPPGVAADQPRVRSESPAAPSGPDDLRRADDADTAGAGNYSETAMDAMVQSRPFSR